MKKEEGLQIPLKQPQAETEGCAHDWVKYEIRGRKALKCKYCGKVIDNQD